ncbi:MAG: hypothetical protein DI610_01985 [Staphylococcus hominis]|nr:MAG: hypothetical protein DI610_01985 [Staphylococcus hominis]
MKVGFLFNHDALHQVRHSAPVVAELARDHRAEVTVLTSSADQEAAVRALIGDAAAAIRFVPLSLGAGARALDAGLRWIAPFRRIAILRENVAAFAELDVLVVPETTSLMLRDRFGLDRLKMVWIPHGAGDRSIGFGPEVARFDLVLLSGEKVRDRMLAAGLITTVNHAIVGYPKFDTVADAATAPFFAGTGPTVLYNPHFDPLLSSWYDWGGPIVRWFAGQGRFNLIVAPHVMLFKRRWHASVEHRRVRMRRGLPRELAEAPNVLFDPGSERSVDMSYTRAADIYLGDASSQIYEWIAQPRPAIFLNPHGLRWQDDPSFAHWQLGEVVDRLDALAGALDQAMSAPHRNDQRQAEAFARTFSITRQSSAKRAADAIMAFFGPSAGPDYDGH